MKTLLQALTEAYEKVGDNAYFGNGFMMGVNFAQHWIPIKEEKPVPYESGDWNGLRTDSVLVKTDEGLEFVARAYEGVFCGENFYKFYDNQNHEITNVIEWRPINYK